MIISEKLFKSYLDGEKNFKNIDLENVFKKCINKDDIYKLGPHYFIDGVLIDYDNQDDIFTKLPVIVKDDEIFFRYVCRGCHGRGYYKGLRGI